MTVIEVLSESADGGTRRSIMGIEGKSIFRIYFCSSEVVSLLASSWENSKVINLLQMAGSSGGMVPYRKLSVGLCYFQSWPSVVALSMPTLIKGGPYHWNPYFISTAMDYLFMGPLGKHWDGWGAEYWHP